MQSLEISLPEEIYNALTAEAARAHRPPADLACQAIDAWLAHKGRPSLTDEIAAYARRNAGTEFDLDPDLEAASVEHLLASDR
jgi:hypothetical protein